MTSTLLARGAERKEDMELVAKVDKHRHITNWIRIWNGGIQLTEKEQVFFGEILSLAMTLKEEGIKEPYLGQLVFSTKEMDKIKTKLGLSKQGLSNYKMALRDKGVIVKNEVGDYFIPPQLIPEKSITFKFVYG